jgi:hypothetical protein
MRDISGTNGGAVMSDDAPVLSRDHERLLKLVDQELRVVARRLPDREAAYLCRHYFDIQRRRVAAQNQCFAADKNGEPSHFASALAKQYSAVETWIRVVLNIYTESHHLGGVIRAVHGIGPVISATVLATVDFGRITSVSQVWRRAGLDPSVGVLEPGKPRPWVWALKQACFFAAQSFVRFSGHPRCYYGRWYRYFKADELSRNERGHYAAVARAKLAAATKTAEGEYARALWSAGKLTAAHLERRAQRRTAKLWLGHIATVCHQLATGEPLARPYVIEHLGHVDEIVPPPHLWEAAGLPVPARSSEDVPGQRC